MRTQDMLVSEDDIRVAGLRQRMDEFYCSIANYDDFAEPNSKPEFWKPVRQAIEQCLLRQTTCRVLEFGAGKTGFTKAIADLRQQIVFHAQDITSANQDYLASQADKLHIGEITRIEETYDVVFSTFTWEHISNPQTALKHLLGCLNSNGTLIIASPRYDFPFYLSPSVRHLPFKQRIKLGLWLSAQRLKVVGGGKGVFLIHLNPACLNMPWFRDADAIHWVSKYDIQRALPHGFRMTRLSIGASGLKGRLWERIALMFIKIDKCS